MAIPTADWRARRRRGEQTILEETAEDENQNQMGTGETKKRGMVEPVAEKVVEAITTTRDKAWEAREHFLDWIWKGEYQAPPVPPCPPCYLLCKCVEPTRIRLIDECNCDSCGQPGVQCADCCGMLPVCPYCGRRMHPQLGLSPCAIQWCPPKPQPLPELVVTSMGPYRDKRYVEERPACSKCVAGLGLSTMVNNFAFDCGQFVGSNLACCHREPPPVPVPGRPIQRLMPCFFPPPQPKRTRFPFSLFRKPPEPTYLPPKGGLAGVIEDCAAIGIGATGFTMDLVSEVLDGSTSYADQLPGAMHCNCNSPPLLYPKNGMYEDPPVAPTKATGWRALDAFNNFMDALTFRPSKPKDIELIREGEIPETEKTGNAIVDRINETLDRVLPPPTEITPSSPRKHDPLQALITYFTNRPVEPKEDDYLFPCLAPDKNGLNYVERHLPTICLGQGLQLAGPRCGPEQIDYVNFTLVPSNFAGFTEAPSGAARTGRTVMPVLSM